MKKIISGSIIIAIITAIFVLTLVPSANAAFYTQTISSANAGNVLSIVSTNEGSTAYNKAYHLFYTSQFAAAYNNRFPYLNSNGYVYSVSDNGTVYSITGSAGCMAYSNYVCKYVFGTNSTSASRKYISTTAGGMTADDVKNVITAHAQCGEHIRIDNTHSISFIAYDANGFYYTSYSTDSDPKIYIRYTTWANFKNQCNAYNKTAWIYNTNTSTNSVSGTVTMLNYSDYVANVITDTNAVMQGQINKPSSYAVTKLGFRITKASDSYANGKSYYHTPSQSYVGSTVVRPYYDVTAELGMTLTHCTSYKCQFYAVVNGNEYWSDEKVFTTTGSHTFGGWTVTNAATCTAAGTKTRACTSCGYSENQTVSATGHNYSGNWTVDTAATCTTAGSKSHHCTKCGSKTDITTISATGHNWSGWTTTTSPTCTTSGKQTRTCLTCGKTETQNINATGHSYSGSWTVDTAATCTTAGSKSHHCTKCNSKTDITTISSTGHNWGSWRTVIEATTTNDGKQQRKCHNNNCNATEAKTIVKLSEDGHTHNFGEWIVTTPATCTKDGQMASSCTICGATQTQTLSATGHDFGEWYNAKEPTTEIEGLEERSCKACLLTEQRVLEKLPAPDVSTDEQVSAPETPLDKDTDADTAVSISKETQKNHDRNILLLLLPIAAVVLSGATALTVINVRKVKKR